MNEPAAPPPPIAPIELRDATIPSRHDPRRLLLEHLDWTVQAGEFWVIGALPGAGLSHLLETAAGLLRVSAGEQRLFGRPVARAAESQMLAERRRIGYVFADGGRLFNHLTLEENVRLPLCYHRDCEAAEVAAPLQELLEFTGVKDYARLMPGRVSRPWRLRAAIARALVLQPEVLILDNPLAGLDPVQGRWLLGFLHRLARGAEALGGRPVTIVVGTNHLRPWVLPTRQFALLGTRGWRCLGGMPALLECDDPIAQELLTAPQPLGSN